MDKITLNLKKREVIGKAVKHLRRAGRVPAVIHNHGKASVVVDGDYVAIAKAYQKVGRSQPLTIKADDKQYTALIKKATFDPRKNTLTHVVFNAVKANQKVTAEVPVRMQLAEDNDSTPAERAGLVVLHQLETVEVEAFPRDLPEAIYFDGEKLVEQGNSATVADLIVPEKVEVKTDPAHAVATVFEPSALQSAEAEEEKEAETEAQTESEEAIKPESASPETQESTEVKQ